MHRKIADNNDFASHWCRCFFFCIVYVAFIWSIRWIGRLNGESIQKVHVYIKSEGWPAKIYNFKCPKLFLWMVYARFHFLAALPKDSTAPLSLLSRGKQNLSFWPTIAIIKITNLWLLDSAKSIQFHFTTFQTSLFSVILLVSHRSDTTSASGNK